MSGADFAVTYYAIVVVLTFLYIVVVEKHPEGGLKFAMIPLIALLWPIYYVYMLIRLIYQLR